jgi:hypothetical protein
MESIPGENLTITEKVMLATFRDLNMDLYECSICGYI